MVKIREVFDEMYEDMLMGFIIELKEQNVNGRKIGKELARITQIIGVWEK